MDLDFTPKKYTINGKLCIQEPLSPLQCVRLALTFDKIMKTFGDRIKTKDGDDFDLTPYLNVLEFEAPELIVDVMNTVLKNPETNKPGYYENYLNLDDFMKIDPATTIEVVADFFTINKVADLFTNLAGLNQLKAMLMASRTGLN